MRPTVTGCRPHYVSPALGRLWAVWRRISTLVHAVHGLPGPCVAARREVRVDPEREARIVVSEVVAQGFDVLAWRGELHLSLGAEEQTRQPTRAHERVAHGRNVVLLLLVLHEHGLTEQVPEGHAQDARQLREHVDPGRLPASRFDLCQPVGAAPNQTEDPLACSRDAPVERDAFADAEVISKSHGTELVTRQVVGLAHCLAERE